MTALELPLVLRKVSEQNLGSSLACIRGYSKFASMMWLRALRQPTPDGVILGRWSRAASIALREFCQRYRCDELLVRTDALNKRWGSRRGGYLVPRSGVREFIHELREEARIAAFLEPLSPFRDRYSLAAITDETQESMAIEIVGPGFDASDLLRGETNPHERIEAHMSRDRNPKKPQIKRQYITRQEDYERSVEGRLIKIGARLRNPAYPQKVDTSSQTKRTRLISRATDYLIQTKQPELLNHLDAYEPVPLQVVRRFASGVRDINAGLLEHGVSLGATSYAGTLTSGGRFVFWDFFPADPKRARQLYLS